MIKEEWEEIKELQEKLSDIKTLKYRFDVLLRKTEKENEHPEDYDGPCFCKLCMSYT